MTNTRNRAAKGLSFASEASGHRFIGPFRSRSGVSFVPFSFRRAYGLETASGIVTESSLLIEKGRHEDMTVQRVVILGRGGAGKSTAARRLGELVGLPIIELDKHFWQPGLAPLSR